MCKYRVGDKVRIRCDLDFGMYGRNNTTEDMVNLRGKFAIITEVGCGYDKNQYHINLDNGECNWTEQMFCDDEANTFTKHDIKNGMFGYTDDGDKFVIANGKLVYQDGTVDSLIYITDDFGFCTNSSKIMAIYDDMYCFNNLNENQRTHYHAVYKREIPELTLDEIKNKLGYDFKLVD